MMELTEEEKSICQKCHALTRQANESLDPLRKKYVGAKVVLTKGWRKGEKGSKAVITEVTEYYGEVLFLCMVINKKGEIVNGDAYTREYREATDFDIANLPEELRG